MTTIGTRLTRIILVIAAVFACTGESSAQYRFQLVHLIAGVPALDLYLQGSPTAYLEDVPFEWQSARSAALNVTTEVTITRANAGIDAPLFSLALPSANGTFS